MSTFIPLSPRLFATRRKRRRGRQAKAGAQGIAEHDHFDRFGRVRSRAWAWAKTGPAVIKATINTRMCANIRFKPSTRVAEVPYDRAMDSLIEPSSLTGLGPDTISISNVNLSLGSGAAAFIS
jgi:hypothetical protein